MTPNIKASDSNWHKTLISFDKRLAIPVDPTQGFPGSQYYIKVSVLVTDDEGVTAPQNTPVYAKDNQNNIMYYWNADKTPNNLQDNSGFRTFLTDSKGVATYYIAFNVKIWGDPEKMAQDPFVGRIVYLTINTSSVATGVPQYPVLFCYYMNESGPYPALNAQVTVPAWSSAITEGNYFISGLHISSNQSKGANLDSDSVLILNDTAFFGLKYSMILNSIFDGIAPYYDLKDQGSNRILYFVQDSLTSPGILSYSTTFDLSQGDWTPQAMPNPNDQIGDGFVTPYWYGARHEPNHTPENTLGPSALNNTWDGSHNLEILIEYPPEGTIEKGDIINVFAYVSGYTKDGAQITQIYGDGSPVLDFPYADSSDNIFQFKAYEGDMAPSPGEHWHSVMIPGAWLEIFGQRTSTIPGYMWVNYLVTPADVAVKSPKWSSPYVGMEAAVQINFAGNHA
ncbi:hypothetical protein GCM10011491_46680 [Brucella endophytica]|uniref:Uncharacterized protein n=1 Tax=Brucella endophytica TaxID=1963359 RepID=A0A916WM75_9HYPH|nr:hypothetical protein [Brucella endophytica]GGB13673.1 hypothetical protein GCM10011491_46680 [Brucella endophytica]